jgi:phosphinothricin acetyltransferase
MDGNVRANTRGAMSAIPTIRVGTESDLPAINAIYNHYVLHSTCTYQITPETDEARLYWFRQRAEVHPVTVGEINGEVVGWASLNRYHAREAYARTVENSIYVRHDWQRRGIGRVLLSDLIVRARQLGHHTILAGISAEQAASVALHEAFGFEPVAHFRELGWKHGQWLDVVYLQLLL